MKDRLEDELRRALRREEPPEGFAARVLAAAQAQAEQPTARHTSVWDWFRMPAVRFALAAAACLVLAAGLAIRQRQMRARGEAAKAQVMLALRITGAKLHVAHAKVTEAAAPRHELRRPQVEKRL